MPLWHYGDAFRNLIRSHTTLIEDNATLAGAFLTRWHGASALTTLTDAQITTNLASDVADSFVQTRDIVCDGEYIYFVLPATWGAPTFTVGGLLNTAWASTTRQIAFTGLDYTIYRSTFPLTGTIRVSLA